MTTWLWFNFIFWVITIVIAFGVKVFYWRHTQHTREFTVNRFLLWSLMGVWTIYIFFVGIFVSFFSLHESLRLLLS